MGSTDKRAPPHLTEREAKAARFEGKDRLIAAGDGLYLLIRPSSKTWVTRRRVAGTMRVRTLGRYPDMPVKVARSQALAEALERVPSATTVEALARDYFSDVVEVEHRRPELFEGYLRRAILPALGNRRVVELTPSDVAAVITDYRSRGARSADQLRSCLRSLFGFAIEIGVRPDNPAALLSARVAGYRPNPRSRVLTDAEIRAVWSSTSPNARTLRFLLLTGLRIGEAQKGARDGDLWRVSARVSKNGRPHWVHLGAAALDQLPLPPAGPTAVQAWLRAWCAREGIEPAFTPHDCRRTFATRAADAGVEPFIIERTLNHTLPGVMGIYNRGEYREQRVAAALAVEAHLLALL
jgi:integrase